MHKVKCKVCGKEELVCPSRFKSYKTCSFECSSVYRKSLNLNCICPICGIKFHAKPHHLKSLKWGEPCCSMSCSAEQRREKMSGENNHQFGLKGELNASFKSKKHISNYGYMLITMPEHPFCDCDGKVREHRIVAEEFLLTEENSVKVDGKYYLDQKLEVHHKDLNRLNNDPSNLMLLTKSEHMTLHQKLRREKKMQNN